LLFDLLAVHFDKKEKKKETQLDAEFFFSTFRQTHLHVSGASKAHHQE
jgi:hypothetical protein